MTKKQQKQIKKYKFDYKGMIKAAKDIQRNREERYPVIKPIDTYEWPHQWNKQGIEDKLEAMASKQEEIIDWINQHAKIKNNRWYFNAHSW